MKKTLLLVSVAAPALAFSAPAQASIIKYDISNATSGSCAHGLWVNDQRSGCAKQFSFQDGSTFTQDTHAGTATFSATAINSNHEVATLHLTFSGFQDEIGSFEYKGGGGPLNNATMDFYSHASGTIKIGDKTYTLKPSDPLAGNTAVQIGPGANDKTGDFGGSAWLNILDPSGKMLKHWDINFDLTRHPGTPVPAPGGLALLGLALAGVWAGRRRRRVAAA